MADSQDLGVVRFLPVFSVQSALNTSSCAYPLSGGYALLPRALFYASLVFTIFGKRWPWLVAGAAASAMVFSSTAAIHAAILVAMPRMQDQAMDMDVFGTYSATSVGLIMVVPILTHSKTMMEQRVRHIVHLWGIFMPMGAVCSTVAMWRRWPVEPICTSISTGANLTSLAQVPVANFTCVYECFSSTSRIRNSDDMVAIPLSTINEWPLIMIFISAMLIGVCSLINIFHFCWTKCRPVGGRHEAHWLILISSLVSPILMITDIAIIETFFANSGVPISETKNLVGQWGTIVGAGLVLFSASIDKWFERRENSSAGAMGGGQDDKVPLKQTQGLATQQGGFDSRTTLGYASHQNGSVNSLTSDTNWNHKPLTPARPSPIAR